MLVCGMGSTGRRRDLLGALVELNLGVLCALRLLAPRIVAGNLVMRAGAAP
jgi:hypothetical protein